LLAIRELPSDLACLTDLADLDLTSCRELTGLQPLAALTSLQSLDLSYCAQVQDLQPLSALRSLRKAWLLGVKIDCSPAAQPFASWIRAVEVYADELIGAPNELGSKNSYDINALPRIRAWQEDLRAGEAPNSTVKIFFLGNGRVGKTQIWRRLLGKPFDPSVSTTHGIDLEEHRILPGNDALPEIVARLWDFGGQSIYHGTHGLFIDDRAIYVLCWSPLYENSDEIEQDGIAMRNRRLRYWVEYVGSLAGQSAPVIVAQTQCDSESDRCEPPLPGEHGFERLLSTYCSAKTPLGISPPSARDRERRPLPTGALWQNPLAEKLVRCRAVNRIATAAENKNNFLLRIRGTLPARAPSSRSRGGTAVSTPERPGFLSPRCFRRSSHHRSRLGV